MKLYLKNHDNSLLFYRSVFIISCFYIIFFVVLDYSKCFANREVIMMHIPRVLSNGTELISEDFKRPFDFFTIPDAPRPRHISHLFQIFSIKFRIWLFEFIPNHPSFNLSWILTLLSPVFLFKFLFNYTKNRSISWIAVLLYILSSGFLSGLTYWLHPGKPLVNFFFIFSLYLASKVSIFGIETKKGKVIFISLIFLFLTAFFTDESALFILPIIPLLFPDIFLNFKRFKLKTLPISLYFSSFVIFLVLLSFIVTMISQHYYNLPFDFWGYFFRTSDDPRLTKSFLNLNIVNLFYYTYSLISSHITFFELPKEHTYGGFPEFNLNYFTIISGILFLIYFFFLFTKLDKIDKTKFFWNRLLSKNNYDKNTIFLRLLIILLLYLLFLTFYQGKHPIMIPQGYYYGAPFSIFFAILLAVLLSTKGKFINIVNKFLLIFIFIASITNFNKINLITSITDTSNWQSYYLIDKELKTKKVKEHGFNDILKVWSNRHDKSELISLYKEMKPYYPNFVIRPIHDNEFVPLPPYKLDWLFLELLYMTKEDGYKSYFDSRLSYIQKFKSYFFLSESDIHAINRDKNSYLQCKIVYPYIIQIYTNNIRGIKRYALQSGKFASMPSEWLLEGSNDNINWAILDKQTYQTNWTDNETRVFKLNSPQKYRHYRFNFIRGPGHMTIYGLKLGIAG